MTNPSPPESQNPIPERRRRPATGVTFDEMIAIIVAFSTIGAILFWSIGSGRNSKFAKNLGLSNIVSGDTSGKVNVSRDLEAENRQLAARLSEVDSPVAYIPPNQKVELSPKVAKKPILLDSGAKLVPLAGVAALPAIKNNPQKNRNIDNLDKTPKAKPQPAIVKQTETPKTKPAPKQTEMPKDVTSNDWAYPFLKQMNNSGLVSALTGDKNFEPDKLITRASMATLISRAFDTQPETQGIKQFQDVTNQNEIAADIDRAVRLGFMKGYSENTFRPLENIPRYQVLVALATGLNLKPSKDADQILQKLNGSENLPDWAKEQIAAAYESNLIVNRPGFANNSLMPNKPATRAEVAAMIHQSLVKEGKLKPLESKYIVKP